MGLVHHHIRFEPQGPGWLLGPARYCCRWLNYWWGYELIHGWLRTGELEWEAPLGMGEALRWRDPGGKPPLDWFGVNYYTRAVSLFRVGRCAGCCLFHGGPFGGAGGREPKKKQGKTRRPLSHTRPAVVAPPAPSFPRKTNQKT